MTLDDIIAWIESIIDAIVQFIVDIAQALFQVLVDVFNALVSVIQDIGTWLQNIWGTLKDFFDDLWWEVITPFIEWCQEIIDDITTWLQNFLDPLITFINNLYQWYKTFIYPILHTILEVISRMRVFLALLKLIGVKWAAKLDADLQLIQAWVTEVVQTITATMNTISTVLGLMTDPSGILRRDFFTGTLFGSLSAVKQASTFGNDRPSLPGELTQIQQNNALVQGDVPVATISPKGVLTSAPGFDALKADVDAGYTNLGVTVLGN